MKLMMQKRNSIAVKLAFIFAVSILVQIILISVLLIYGGVFRQTEDNAYEFFSEKVSHRKSSLENEMNNVWTNFDQYMEKISRYYSLYGKDQSRDQFLLNVAPLMQDALGTTKTTGIFLIMDEEEESNGYDAMYLRNANPGNGITDSASLILVAGPWDIAKQMRITTSENWSINLHLNRENRDFYEKVSKNRQLSKKEKLLGYWAPPFCLTSEDEKIITYSLPLNDENGRFIGVFGIEISMSYLYKFLPPSDLQSQDAYGYLIGMRKEHNAGIYPVAAREALQSHIIDLGQTLSMKAVSPDYGIYKLKDVKGGHDVYASVQKLGLYYSNTPFESEEWFLIGVMEEQDLLHTSHRISQILMVAFCICVISGLLIAIIVSRRFTRPIIQLAEQVSHNDTAFSATGYAEIDWLANAICSSQERLITLSQKLSRIIELTGVPFGAYEMNRNSNDVFVTNHLAKLFRMTEPQAIELFADKHRFEEYMTAICRNTTEEENVYAIESDSGVYFLRVTQTETEDAVLGVVMEVTEEILNTESLKEERDRDPLTGIRNRYAFKRSMFYYDEHLHENRNIGMALFDLNGLKAVNDQWGHEKGDQYLKLSCEIICKTFVDAFVYRIGGDEFVAIFFHRSAEDIDHMHRQLMEKTAGYNKYGDFTIGIAFGYAFYDETSDSKLEEVLARADFNMYANKREMKKSKKD